MHDTAQALWCAGFHLRGGPLNNMWSNEFSYIVCHSTGYKYIDPAPLKSEEARHEWCNVVQLIMCHCIIYYMAWYYSSLIALCMSYILCLQISETDYTLLLQSESLVWYTYALEGGAPKAYG